MEKIVGLIDGPVGNLVGAGLQVIVSRIANGSRSSNGCDHVRYGAVHDRTPKDSENQRIMRVYDQFEAHLHGAMKVLKPALEIKEMMMNQQRSKSADVRLEKSQESEIHYYTPQKNSSQSSNQNRCRCNGGRSSKSRYDSQSVKENFVRESNDSKMKRQKFESFENSNPFVCSSPLMKKKKTCSTSSVHSISRLSNISKIRNNDVTETDELKSCGKCGISMKVVKKLAVIPCGHTFCYRCIPPTHFAACPICTKPLTSSSIKTLTY